MRKATLTRNESGDTGTFGTLVTDQGFICRTGELPWRGNQTGISSIPAGVYTCTWRNSPKHGMCYHVENVPGRTDVEIHSANFMGDQSLGFRCELKGCIAPGLSIGVMNGQKAISYSKQALSALEKNLKQETFELTILG